jgi:hypothetical protein
MKIRSPQEYLSFRNSLASKYLNKSDVESLKKISIALLNGQSTESVAEEAIPKPNLTIRQKKNKRTRVNKSSKMRAVAQLKSVKSKTSAPWFDVSERGPPPKKPRIGRPFLATTPRKPWVEHMPIVKFDVYEWDKRVLTTIERIPLTEGSYATRPIKEEEYRHEIGAHTKEEECHLCDQVYRYHFFDDYPQVTSRLIAFVALHHWIDQGQCIKMFNWCPQTWHKDACAEGDFIRAAEVGTLIKSYISDKKVVDNNQIRTPHPDGGEKVVEKRPPNPNFSFRLTR